MAPKICACTLVSMIVVLIVGDVLQGRACGEYNGHRLFGSGRSTRLSLGSLSLVEDLTLKMGLGETLHTLVGNWSRSPDEPKIGRNQSRLCYFH